MIAKNIIVKFEGFEVGVLSQLEGANYASFQYYPDWVAEGFSISPLEMPLTSEVYSFPALPKETFKGLPGVFADSLPDDFGNAVINQWLAKQGKDKNEFGALDRLLYIGKRGMGGLEYEPALANDQSAPETLDIAELAELAQSVLNDREGVSVDTREDDGIYQLFQIGTSAGGARAKAVIAMNNDRTHIISGQVAVPDGYQHFLIKFDGINTSNTEQQAFGDPKGYGAMEYAYYRMAVDCGIDMSPCELLEEGGRKHFVTKRFDREQNQKYHVLSLCGMDHTDFRQVGQYSYEELLAVARRLNLTHSEQVEIFKRMVFNVVARNHDDHTKNFAFLVDDNIEWALAPAFDIAYSYKPESQWVAKHSMTINSKREGFDREDLLTVSDLITELKRNEAEGIIDATIDVVKQWESYAETAGVPNALIELISSNLRIGL